MVKVGTPVVLAATAALAAIDPSITNIVLGLITAFTTVAALHYGFKTAALNKTNQEKDAKLAEKDARLKALETPIKEKEKIP